MVMTSALRSDRSSGFERRKALVACIGAGVVASASAAHGQEPRIDFASAWFLPSLIEDRAPVCADVLAFAQELFASDRRIDGLGDVASYPIRGLETARELATETFVDNGLARTEHFVVTRDKKLYLDDAVAPGTCGGACDGRQIYASPVPFPSRIGQERAAFRETLPEPTPVTYSHALLRGGDLYYVILIADDVLQLLELTADGAWAQTCSVRLAPDDMRIVDDAAVRAAATSIDELRTAVRGLTRDAGNCGSMATHARWDRYVTQRLEALLYRPHPPVPDARRDDATYDVDLRNMRTWALTGLSERNALRAYETQFERTTADLASFYSESYRLEPDAALRWATAGLKSAISAGIRFYMYEPFARENEQRLRTAILARRPIDELRAIEVPLQVIDGDDVNFDRFNESLLNTAVEYPEAVAYLLELGANPNKANDFGKTPLMYAAQHDAVVSAELLLDAGADPNAATVWPADDCYYTLSRASMTPLHYAVRYASPAFVELLLERGAVTYIKTNTPEWRRNDEYPSDWLRTYTAPDAAERNPNISEADAGTLAALVAVPSAERRNAIATQLTMEAEGQYAAGNAPAAYALLERAQQADDSNLRTQSDMSLVALRVDRPAEAALAAHRLIEVTDDASLEANAWFNLGLACEGPGSRYGVRYGDTFPCYFSAVFPFLQAWLTQPTGSRLEKIIAVFEERASCGNVRSDGSIERYFIVNAVSDPGSAGGSRIYAYHPPSVEIDPERVIWQLPGQPGVHPAVQLIARHNIGDHFVSVLATRGRFYAPVGIGEVECGLVLQE